LNNPGRATGPEQFSVAERGSDYIDEDLTIALTTMGRVSPAGVTPLAEHVRAIRTTAATLSDQLRRTGQKIVVVLATDGLPNNSPGRSSPNEKLEFQNSIKSLEGLPVWIVIRLCTDEDDVVDYYNNLDTDLELSVEVIRDFVGEAKEVHEHNPWLNYALPLHRIREMGFSHKLFDLLDEREFTKYELRDFFLLIFGADRLQGVPDPEVDWKGFFEHVSSIVDQEEDQWNPIKQKTTPWIDMKVLSKVYGDSLLKSAFSSKSGFSRSFKKHR